MSHDNEARGMRSYGTILRRWLWLILLLIAVTIAVIYVRASMAPPVYQASVTLQVIALEPEEVTLYTDLRGTVADEQIRAVRDEFVTILESNTIAWRTIGELDLSVDARQLLRAIEVRSEDEFINVAAQAVGPQAAEALVTTHVNKGLEYYRQVRALPAEITEQFILEQLQDSKEELANAEQRFLQFKLRHRVDALHREITTLYDIIRDLEQERDQSRVDIERSLALADEMKDNAAAALTEAQQADEAGQQARETVRQLKSLEAERLAAEEAAATEATAGAAEAAEEAEEAGAEAIEEAEVVAELPQAQDTAALIEEAQAEADEAQATETYYRSLARTLQASADNQDAAAEAARIVEAEYGQIIADREAELASLIGLGAEYDTLENDLSQARGRVSFLAEKAYEAETKKSQALGASYLQIIEPAHTPGSPMPSNIWQLMALGAVVSLIVGMILAFLLEILTNSRRQAQQPRGG